MLILSTSSDKRRPSTNIRGTTMYVKNLHGTSGNKEDKQYLVNNIKDEKYLNKNIFHHWCKDSKSSR